jgi:undecaprenyl phosphate-alpha-L-ara4N flippase subunit ArnE
MLQARSWISALPVTLVLANLLFQVVANASFKASAISGNLQGFLSWQVVGNLAGLVTVLTLTGLLRFVPLSVAFPLTTGLAVIGVQVLAGQMIFHEPISSEQWVGTLLIVAGIAIVGSR